MSIGLKQSILPSNRVPPPLQLAFCLLLCLPLALSQQAAQKDGGAPKYDQKTEAKTKGVVDEINLLTLGSRKDFVQLVVKSGDDKVSAYICPKPFQDEIGITFAKGDEITLTGSKVKQQDLDVILVRELVKGTDTLMFRDDKGTPVWDWRTGK
jgi:hypothetical protein